MLRVDSSETRPDISSPTTPPTNLDRKRSLLISPLLPHCSPNFFSNNSRIMSKDNADSRGESQRKFVFQAVETRGNSPLPLVFPAFPFFSHNERSSHRRWSVTCFGHRCTPPQSTKVSRHKTSSRSKRAGRYTSENRLVARKEQDGGKKGLATRGRRERERERRGRKGLCTLADGFG